MVKSCTGHQLLSIVVACGDGTVFLSCGERHHKQDVREWCRGWKRTLAQSQDSVFERSQAVLVPDGVGKGME